MARKRKFKAGYTKMQKQIEDAGESLIPVYVSTSALSPCSLLQSASQDSNGQEVIPIQHKRHRGPTLMNNIWELEDGIKMEVQVGVAGIPVGDEAGRLANFIGSVVRRADLVPLGYKDWRLMEPKHKKAIWDTIEAKVEFRPFCTEGTRIWVMHSAATKWRGWKNEIKHRVFNKNRTPQQMWEKLTDHRVDKNQFFAVVDIWLSDGHQRTCEKNRKNRQKFDDPHCSGTKTFARLIHEKIQAEGTTPTRAEIYMATRKHKDGTVVNEKAKNIMELMQKYQNETGSSTSHEKPKGQEDVYLMVNGPEKRCSIRFVGAVPSPKCFMTTTSTQENMQQTLNGVLDVLTGMTQMWKEQFPNANMKNVVETAKHLAAQVLHPKSSLDHTSNGKLWYESTCSVMHGIEDVMYSDNLQHKQPPETPATVWESSSQSMMPDPSISVVEDSYFDSTETLGFDPMLTEEINNSKKRNEGTPLTKITPVSPSFLPSRVLLINESEWSNAITEISQINPVDKYFLAHANDMSNGRSKSNSEGNHVINNNSPVHAKVMTNRSSIANTEIWQNRVVDNNLSTHAKNATKSSKTKTETNLASALDYGDTHEKDMADNANVDVGFTFQPVVDVAKEAIILSQFLCDPKLDFHGYGSITRRGGDIIQAFRRDSADKLNAHFFTPLDNFCLGKHIHNLLCGGIVEDKIIDMYMDVLYCKHSQFVEEFPFFFATLRVTQLVKIRVKRGTSINLSNLFTCHRRSFEHLKKVFCVMLTSNHRHLLVTDFQAKLFKVYNSIYGNRRHRREAERWKHWIAEFYTDNYTKENLHDWELEFVKDCPQQVSKDMDCGIYVMKFMEYLCEDSEPDFSDTDIPRFRREIAAQLLTCGGEKNSQAKEFQPCKYSFWV